MGSGPVICFLLLSLWGELQAVQPELTRRLLVMPSTTPTHAILQLLENLEDSGVLGNEG